MNALPVAFAFSAGMLASVNPCGFAMLPAFVGSYLGAAGSSRAGPGRRLLEGVAVGAVVTVGFVALFGAAGLLISAMGNDLLAQFPMVVLVGVGLVGLGVWLAAGRPLGLSLGIDVRVGRRRGLAAAAWFGVAYGLASLACTLPVFLVAVGSAFSAGSVLGGLGLFVAYALGMGSVVTAVAVGAALLRGAVARWLRRAIPVVQQLSGALRGSAHHGRDLPGGPGVPPGPPGWAVLARLGVRPPWGGRGSAPGGRWRRCPPAVVANARRGPTVGLGGCSYPGDYP